MRVIFACGATGGHLYPALSIAEKLKEKYPDMEALFVTTKRDISSEIIEASGYSVINIDVATIDRKHLLNNINALKILGKSMNELKKILSDFKPDFIVGTGGSVSGVVARAAYKKRIPVFLQEQNVLPGLANKLAEKYANKIFVAFEESKERFKNSDKIIYSGNPLRSNIIKEMKLDYKEKLKEGKDLVLLIFAGSQGSNRINDITSDFLISIKNRSDIEVYFITGHRMYERIRKKLDKEGVTKNEKIHVLSYAQNIHRIYLVADIIISRSGALTVSEIATMGIPSILIPSPNVSENHQYYNAKVIEDRGAGLIVEEKNLTMEFLTDEVNRLWNDKELLLKMSENTAKVRQLDAADIIVNSIISAIDKH